jgi:hypothetical protein
MVNRTSSDVDPLTPGPAPTWLDPGIMLYSPHPCYSFTLQENRHTNGTHGTRRQVLSHSHLQNRCVSAGLEYCVIHVVWDTYVDLVSLTHAPAPNASTGDPLALGWNGAGTNGLATSARAPCSCVAWSPFICGIAWWGSTRAGVWGWGWG